MDQVKVDRFQPVVLYPKDNLKKDFDPALIYIIFVKMTTFPVSKIEDRVGTRVQGSARG